MLSDRERRALEQWYSREEVKATARRLYEAKDEEDLEDYVHRGCLLPLSNHFELPDFMRNEDGHPLFSTNLNPGADLEKWQDAIEIGWAVLEREIGIRHDDIHKRVAERQKDDWAAFLDSVDRRKRERAARD